MDPVFVNYPTILKYFTPSSYLDVGVCKGHAIPFILKQLPSLSRIEMIEANLLHEADLKIISKKYNIPYKMEVLSDTVRDVTFYLDGKGKNSTGPGNSYYLENTPHFLNTPSEIRRTNTLDTIYNNGETFDFIKMDTQGSELDIIKGGCNLMKYVKGIILEENVFTYNFGAAKHDEVKKYMESIGFTMTDILSIKHRMESDRQGVPTEQKEMDVLYIRTDILN